MTQYASHVSPAILRRGTQRTRILLVDDENAILVLVVSVLFESDMVMRCSPHRNGATAIAILRIAQTSR